MEISTTTSAPSSHSVWSSLFKAAFNIHPDGNTGESCLELDYTMLWVNGDTTATALFSSAMAHKGDPEQNIPEGQFDYVSSRATLDSEKRQVVNLGSTEPRYVLLEEASRFTKPMHTAFRDWFKTQVAQGRFHKRSEISDMCTEGAQVVQDAAIDRVESLLGADIDITFKFEGDMEPDDRAVL